LVDQGLSLPDQLEIPDQTESARICQISPDQLADPSRGKLSRIFDLEGGHYRQFVNTHGSA
jgi:hypothetical protein